MNIPRLMIAGVQSGVGKTTITLGIMAALHRLGLSVQPYKVGPDYIDPGLHYHAAERMSHNLDSWMGSEEVVRTVFLKNAKSADISVIEGVMGVYDGAKASKIEGSSAHVALILNTPVILVVNAQGMARSCIALVKGFKEYEPRLNLQGVILNYAGDYHRSILKGELEDELGVKVLGCLPRQQEIVMPARHLGLLPAEENKGLKTVIAAMADMIEREIDLDMVISLAGQAAELEVNLRNLKPMDSVKIAVARDDAFSFYYQDNLDYLEEMGGEFIYFSPLHDKEIPSASGLYLGGGFPEMFLPQLSANDSMLTSIRFAKQNNMPIYAECGGLMYLTRIITDFEDRKWPGVGIIPAEVKMSKKLQALGYIEATALKNSIVARKGEVLRGHEFHYSQIMGLDNNQSAYSLVGGKGEDYRREGYVDNNLLASYIHLHFRSNPSMAARFLQACRGFKG